GASPAWQYCSLAIRRSAATPTPALTSPSSACTVPAGPWARSPRGGEWVVSGTNGGNLMMARGETQTGAWWGLRRGAGGADAERRSKNASGRAMNRHDRRLLRAEWQEKGGGWSTTRYNRPIAQQEIPNRCSSLRLIGSATSDWESGPTRTTSGSLPPRGGCETYRRSRHFSSGVGWPRGGLTGYDPRHGCSRRPQVLLVQVVNRPGRLELGAGGRILFGLAHRGSHE